MPDILGKYVKEIETTFGETLKAVILFGSKAGGRDVDKNSDHNLLVLLDKVIPDQLSLLAPPTKKWVKEGNPAPVIFSVSEFLGSADVFPIEYIDMKNTHRLLFGRDFLAETEVNDKHLRHECEFELRSKLLKLRQSYLTLKSHKNEIRNVLTGSISSFLVLFKHTVKLLGEAQPVMKIDSLNVLSKRTGLRPDVFTNIYKMKHGDKQIQKLDPEKLMEEYMLEIEKVITVVDNI